MVRYQLGIYDPPIKRGVESMTSPIGGGVESTTPHLLVAPTVVINDRPLRMMLSFITCWTTLRIELFYGRTDSTPLLIPQMYQNGSLERKFERLVRF